MGTWTMPGLAACFCGDNLGMIDGSNTAQSTKKVKCNTYSVLRQQRPVTGPHTHTREGGRDEGDAEFVRDSICDVIFQSGRLPFVAAA